MLGASWQVSGLAEHPGVVLPEETGETFEENAVLKAVSASSALPDHLVLADDSGLEVDSLGGAPGVRSARYAGENATDADNRAQLRDALRRKAYNPGQSFRGRFRCCLALARAGKVLNITHGVVEGSLLQREQGKGGFGYDPMFVPTGHLKSFGLLPAHIKNELSHRARALQKMKEWLASAPGL